MEQPLHLRILRDIAATLFVTFVFMFPILWWALTSIKPISAMFDKDRVVYLRLRADADQLCRHPVRHVAHPASPLTGHRHGRGGRGSSMIAPRHP